ncbi:hypothetical protein EQG49_05690 [Periweissella cryptocerci]|uniref:Lipoprotein n=1 Tax=Periweissella cryptocerci TaxID=2506420 RepID=A0A4P6YTK5_9LACO|nr:hypothetical protein [Periweissella cryptocerci]QBO35987.1 hypothetical protein EQG49_05690 [Periweissella cryptocerci]
MKKINKLVAMSLVVISVGATTGCSAQLASDNHNNSSTKQVKSSSVKAETATKIANAEKTLQDARNLTDKNKFTESNEKLNTLSVTELAQDEFKAIKTAVDELRTQNDAGIKAAVKAKAKAKKKAAKAKVSKQATAKQAVATQATKITRLTDSQKAMFTDWAATQAAKGGMALSELYFNHGAAGQGDWYADTVNGRMQEQDLGNPGYGGFDLHALHGVVFFYANDGTTGYDYPMDEYTTVDGYMDVDQDRPVHKYVLADDGKVYEWISQAGAFASDGFGEMENNGQVGEYSPDGTFIVSGDDAAQQEYQAILGN